MVNVLNWDEITTQLAHRQTNIDQWFTRCAPRIPRDPRSTSSEQRIPSEIVPDHKGSATISEGIRGYISVTATLKFTVVIEGIFY